MDIQPVAIVTGAAGEIGAATAFELAKRGYRLALVDCEAEKLNGVCVKTIEAGVDAESKKKTISITDRHEAIKTACHLALAGDIVLVAGKGHEKYQEVKGVRSHFDDKEELLKSFV